MLPVFQHRFGHVLILIFAWALLCTINLGAPGLWDQDEGLNAEAAREMLAAKDWVVPTFNYRLRTAKPALLYWLQMLSYQAFGVNEFAARLPSALAALLSMLLVYGLGRRMFDPSTGLLAGLMLGSSILFCGSAHFANPDALLHFCTVLTFFLFWRSYSRNGNGWLALCGIATGLGMLAKGPVGLLLPLGGIGLFLLWMRQLRRWLHPTLILGVLLFTVIAIPWYAWVAAETRGVFLKEFFLKDHFERFRSSMESHSGPPFYYLLILCAGLAPWSVFFLFTGWHVRQWRRENAAGTFDPRYRFLFCWMAVYLIPFSIAATKLPNYVLPMYAPLVLLMAHALIRWRRGEYRPPQWIWHVSIACLVLLGAGTAVAGLIGGGVLLPDLTKDHSLRGLEYGAILGFLPIVGGVLAWRYWRRGDHQAALRAVAVCGVLFTAGIAAWGFSAVDRHKAVRPLAQKLHERRLEGEVRVASYDYFQPSLVFYCRRRVQHWTHEGQALEFVRYQLPTYLFLPEHRLAQLRSKSPVPLHELGRRYDFERGYDVVLITNRAVE